MILTDGEKKNMVQWIEYMQSVSCPTQSDIKDKAEDIRACRGVFWYLFLVFDGRGGDGWVLGVGDFVMAVVQQTHTTTQTNLCGHN